MTQYTADQILAALKGRPILAENGWKVVLDAFSPDPFPGKYPLHGYIHPEDGRPAHAERWSLKGEFMVGVDHEFDIDIAYFMGLAAYRPDAPKEKVPKPFVLPAQFRAGSIAALDVAIGLIEREIAETFNNFGAMENIKALLDHQINLTFLKMRMEEGQ